MLTKRIPGCIANNQNTVVESSQLMLFKVLPLPLSIRIAPEYIVLCEVKRGTTELASQLVTYSISPGKCFGLLVATIGDFAVALARLQRFGLIFSGF